MDTTLQRLTTLEGSVSRLEQDVGSLSLPSSLKIIDGYKQVQATGEFLNVSGKGAVYAAGFLKQHGGNNSEMMIYIDGELRLTIVAISQWQTLYCVQSGVGVLCDTLTTPVWVDINTTRKIETEKGDSQSSILAINSAPLFFNKSLRIAYKVSAGFCTPRIAYNFE